MFVAIFAALSGRRAVAASGVQIVAGIAQSSVTPDHAVPVASRITSYTLPPDLYRKARHLGQISFWGQIATFIYSVLILCLILRLRLAARFRDWAERVSAHRFVQASIFTPPLMVTLGLLGIPADAAEHWVARKFGLSVEGWLPWLWDWAKSGFLVILLAIFLVWILYWLIRRSPRRWWFYFWLASLPITAFLVFLQPVVVDPMFHRFDPLAQKDTALTVVLEKMLQRAGENIPPQRMFWMGASEKSTELNAYVTGIGASKRIVVWDTTIGKLNIDQTVAVVGHEMGHYVLHHVAKGLAAAAAFLFVLFYAGYRSFDWLLVRHSARWGIRAANDWAGLPALLLLLAIFSFVANPLQSAFSRYIEHQADQYGLEVTHGLFPDSSQVTAQSFQILGEVDLADPAPNPLDVFLFYSHPPIADRIRFAISYDPWSHGGHGEFVP